MPLVRYRNNEIQKMHPTLEFLNKIQEINQISYSDVSDSFAVLIIRITQRIKTFRLRY